jgi:hypothetical protein
VRDDKSFVSPEVDVTTIANTPETKQHQYGGIDGAFVGHSNPPQKDRVQIV